MVSSPQQPSFHVAEGVLGGNFHRSGHQREGREDVGEFRFGQAVEMGNESIKLGPKGHSFRRIGNSLLVAFYADIPGQIVEHRRRANESSGSLHDGGKRIIAREGFFRSSPLFDMFN